jgi:hypothetical protein
MSFDWYTPVAYSSPVRKRSFHATARSRLAKLAKHLELEVFEIRSNKAGMAVSGEITLHGEHIYVQVSQPVAGSPDSAILVRRCNGMKDYTGDRNHFFSIALLDDVSELADLIERDLGPATKPMQTRLIKQEPNVE